MIYPGMTYIGSNKFSALYGQNDTIIDQKATGLQHLYVDNFEKDLIHTGCTVIKVDDTIYYADRIKPKIGHPLRHASQKSYVLNHAIMVDNFVYPSFTKTDYVGAHEHYIRFRSVIKNTSNITKEFTCSALTITNPNNHVTLNHQTNTIKLTIAQKTISVIAQNNDYSHISLDAPSGFMYHGFEDILFDKNKYSSNNISTDYPVASSLNHTVTLHPNQTYTYDWMIFIGENEQTKQIINTFQFDNQFEDIKAYWNNYLKNIKEPYTNQASVKTKLIALKGALLDGLLPADLTGHYVANGHVCFYSRDALMGSRAFLYAGLYQDFESIVHFFLSCERKENGEFYQRYRFDKVADEGANNNVFAQIDFIGYFTRVVTDYYHLTNKLICDFDEIKSIVDILHNINQKNGLFGPEGGVNEGVYGPAYITSTNMFIAGGLKGVIELAKIFHKPTLFKEWSSLYQQLHQSIEQTFQSEYYYYGYVNYHDEIIKRYDTPQLMSASLGYPLTKQYIQSYETLLTKASYFQYGIGYSEQEYHDGPWIFNTAAAAQVAYLTNDMTSYDHIMNWLVSHQNAFCMNPEAIDAKNEDIPFINPLMWANSEFVCSAYSNIIKLLRSKS